MSCEPSILNPVPNRFFLLKNNLRVRRFYSDKIIQRNNDVMYVLDFMGLAVLDPEFSRPMLPWVVREVIFRADPRQVQMTIKEMISNTVILSIRLDQSQVETQRSSKIEMCIS